jgi:hypothetical protein
LRKLLRLYVKVERGLFDACHPRRLNGSYSLVCGNYFASNVEQINPRGFKQEIYGQLYNGGKKLTKSLDIKSDFIPYYSGRRCRSGSCKTPTLITTLNEYNFCVMCASKSGAEWVRYTNTRCLIMRKCDGTDREAPVDRNGVCEKCFQKGSRIHQQLVAKADKITRQIRSKSHNLRYRALNLHSYFHRGSIEFRHHEGTTDYDTIVGFALICRDLIDAASAMTESQVDVLPKNSRKAMIEILTPQSREYIGKAWTRNDALRNDRSNVDAAGWRASYTEIWKL